jgi:hypothetical protein
METILKKIKHTLVYGMALFTLCASISLTSCDERPYNTQSDQNFDNEENLPQQATGDTTNPAGIREDSTPAAHPDQDANPIIDKGMSTDSAMREERKRRQ